MRVLSFLGALLVAGSASEPQSALMEEAHELVRQNSWVPDRVLASVQLSGPDPDEQASGGGRVWLHHRG